MARFLLHHRHEPQECGVAYASFKGEASPLRRTATVASCLAGGHEIWWLVEAASPKEALGQLPHYVAVRSTASPITEVQIP
jgi:hypothetical protein